MSWSEATYDLRCANSGAQHVMHVSTPMRYEKLDAAPLIVCLDGAWISGTVRDATRLMSMSGEAPEAIVAGLSFVEDSMSDYLRSRTRWFCPTEWVPPEIVGAKVTKPEQTGQALTYLAFIRDQVLPRVQRDYRVSDLWLVGHSFSALFGLRSMFAEPGLFDRYLLASPSVWWHDRAIFEFEAQYAADHDDLVARVFMTAGADEAGLGTDFNMVGNMIDIATKLTGRGYPGLRIDHAVLPAETHSSTIGAAVSRGIRALHSGG